MNKSRIISLILGLFVAGIIFYMSSLSFPSSESGTYISLRAIIYHLSIFFFLSFFITFAVQPKNKSGIFFTISFLTIYAILDEFHQSFVPGRSSNFFDIGINFIGILIGISLYLIWKIYWKFK
jgi:VanZ family protein